MAHFTAEEALMRCMNYPQLDAHKDEHKLFITRVAEEKERAQRLEQISLDMMYFLKDWLVDHILVSDRSYAGFVLSQGKSERRSVFGSLFHKLL